MIVTKTTWRGVALAIAIALGMSATVITPTPAQAAATIAFTSSSAPVISGSATVGSTLTVATGAWNPAPTSFAFKWWSDGVAVAGATASTYAVRTADVGRQITVTITGAKPGYTALSRSSAATARVTGPASSTIPAPSVRYEREDPSLEPDATVQVRLFPDFGGIDVQDANFEYELDGSGVWIPSPYMTVDIDWQIIPIPAGEHVMSWRVAGTLNGKAVVGAASPREAIVSRGFPTQTQPTAKVSGSSVTFTWDARDALNGNTGAAGVFYGLYGVPGIVADRVNAPIAGSLTFDVGYSTTARFYITFAELGDNAGWGEVSATTGPKPSATQLLKSTPAPSIVGTAKVGNLLTVRTSTWEPKPVALSYQWNRNGNAIPGATDATYTVVPADAGTQITISVTGAKTGFTSVTKTSAATARVPQPIITGVAPTVSGVLKVGQKLTAKAGAWTPLPVTVTYQWKRNGIAIPGATATTYSLVAADKGTTITVATTGAKPGYPSVVKTSAGKRIA
ncbi:hypothetical protein CMsap09_14735 [Clavibacter michiganensis]|uniref:Uncharacterized protein n=1 Tax=Clavibacter michiganensis TaxID=28447 RepID=A0A251XXF9_9MICO|nr:hypothetical protein CMsap09_14735 [Clavibacter michiganensis]